MGIFSVAGDAYSVSTHNLTGGYRGLTAVGVRHRHGAHSLPQCLGELIQVAQFMNAAAGRQAVQKQATVAFLQQPDIE